MLVALDVLQVHGHRVLSGIGLVDIANTMGGQVDLAILLIGKLVLSGGGGTLLLLSVLMRPIGWGVTDPSYSPTLSWTKRRTSSGR